MTKKLTRDEWAQRADYERNAELIQRIDTAIRERDQARQMLRYCYKRWPAPIFWQAAAQIDNPYIALPDWLTDVPAAAKPPPLTPGLPGYACARCGNLFTCAGEPQDEHSRHADSAYCRGCVDQCHEASDGHQCVICTPR